MNKEKFVLEGPELKEAVPVESVAECLIPLMKEQPGDLIVQIDVGSGEKINSRDFLKLSLEVTEGLVNFGLEKGDVVMMSCPNSIKCLATALGIMFSGGVLAPTDQNLKPLEMQHLLREFRPRYIICESVKANEMRDNVQKLGLKANIIRLDSKERTSEFFGWQDITTQVDVDNYKPRKVGEPKTDLALISCSSGSTGLPKGVALSHYSILYNDTIFKSVTEMDVNSCILLTSPLFWISGTLLLITSCTSKQIRIIPKSTGSTDLLEAIKKYQPKFSMLSPPGILNLIEHPNFKADDVKSLDYLFTGGSVLGLSLVEKLKGVWPNLNLIQGYGMTEVCGPVTATTVGGDLRSVGQLVPNTKLKIADPSTGESLGPNQTGECRIKADRVMNGYYNNPEATKNTFDEGGWLKTGDLGYYDENGYLYIRGRIKEAIKYKNYQICPTEIESFLIGLPDVTDAAIVPIPKGDSDHHLKAVVVKKPKSQLTADYIIQSVKESFSDYKHLKEGVVFVEALPRTEVGKLKRCTLQNMYGTN